MKVSKALLFVFILILSCKTTSTRSGLSADERVSHKKLFHVCKNTTTCYNYNELFIYARALLSQKVMRKALKEKFPKSLKIDDETAEILELDGSVAEFSEHQLINMIQRFPFSLKYFKKIIVDNIEDEQEISDLLDELVAEFESFVGGQGVFVRSSKPGKPFALKMPDDIHAFTNLEMYVNHPVIVNGKLDVANKNFTAETLAGDTVNDLSEVMIDFINNAQKEIVINVFDFNHSEIASALIGAVSNGVDVRVGIDKRTSSVLPNAPHPVNPLNLILVKNMKAGGVKVTSVNSTGLNHQKIIARDWSKQAKGAVLFSSANMTNSGIHLKGDLGDGTVAAGKEKYALPNANHVITFDSDIGAALINHELSKVLGTKDELSAKHFQKLDVQSKTKVGEKYNFILRGSQLPFSGSYKLVGKNKEEINITFTPGGALKSVNQIILADMITKKSGQIRMAQFAFSSKYVSDAIIERMASDAKSGEQTDFLSVGDKPFALAYWSQFLRLSDIVRKIPEPILESAFLIQDIDRQSSKTFFDKKIANIDNEISIKNDLSKEAVEYLRSRVCSAPYTYGNKVSKLYEVPEVRDANGKLIDTSTLDILPIEIIEDIDDPEVGDQVIKLSAKIHHKLIQVGLYSSVGSSFNFSNGAETNSEQIVIVKSNRISKLAAGIVDYLAYKSVGSVYGQAIRSNGYKIKDAVNGQMLVGKVKDLNAETHEITATISRAKKFGLLDGDSKDHKCLHGISLN